MGNSRWGLVALALALVTTASAQVNNLNGVSVRYDDARTDPAMTRDKDVGRDAYELIASKGYEVEEHRVTTEDGYILGIIRIVGSPNRSGEAGPCPGGSWKPPVLLQHGLIDSAATWVMNMPEQSLGFVLADLGYDVWLGNNRGTSYSLEHTTLKRGFDSWDEEFWDFSWGDMAEYDLPAEMRHILGTTGAEKLAYIGHSQGTTQAFAAFSMPKFADLAERVSVHIALAPVAYVGNTESALFQAVSHLDILRDLATIPEVQSFGNRFLGTGMGARFVESLVPGICDMFLGGCDVEHNPSDPHNEIFNVGLMGDLFGLPDMKHLNQTRIPVYLAHLPEGTSVKNLMHWAQSVKTEAFRPYDYGASANMMRYGQGTPPSYKLERYYRVPTVLLSGTRDPIANRRDVRRLVRTLSGGDTGGRGALLRARELQTYDHNDFTLSIDGHDVFFPFLIDYLERTTRCERRGSDRGGDGEDEGEGGGGDEAAVGEDWVEVLGGAAEAGEAEAGDGGGIWSTLESFLVRVLGGE